MVGRQINRVVAHPTLPLTITAHDDRHIRFYDNTSGKLVHSMVAHLDAVTSLAVDPNGLYLLSGSMFLFFSLHYKDFLQAKEHFFIFSLSLLLSLRS